MEIFPTVAWFQRLREQMAEQEEKYKQLGVIDMTLVVKIMFPNGRCEYFSLEFDTYRCREIRRLAAPDHAPGRHPLMIEGEYGAWREMIENIREHGSAGLKHTLNYLTLPDWPFRLFPVRGEEGQLEVDRFYRYNQTLQEFFNESAAVETRFPNYSSEGATARRRQGPSSADLDA